ncbi:IS200/IS605 family accessory protein TnpB-related protein, partial [Hydrogenibacillus schlegelii]
MHASREKRVWIAGILANEVADWLASLGVRQVDLEVLFFDQDQDSNKVFIRITHYFTKYVLFTRLIVDLRKHGIALINVPAAYTSLIGFFKYAETYGLNAHQAAALVIARRALGFKEKVPKGLLQK